MKKKALYFSDHIENISDNRIGKNKKDIRDSTRWKEGITGLNSVLPSSIRIQSWRVAILIAIMMIAVLVLCGRLFILQVVRGREYYLRSERNRIHVKNIFPERGIIYDRNQSVLARNKPVYSLAVVYSELALDQIDRIRTDLTNLIGIDEALWREAIEYARQNPYLEVIIRKNLTHSEQLAFQVQQESFPGLVLIQDVTRQYPMGEYFSAILGYTGVIDSAELTEFDPTKYTWGSFTGKDGVEKQYEQLLSGKLGQETIEVEASGKTTNQTLIDTPQSGSNITLTIDASVQQKLGELLAAAIDKYSAWAGSAIIMDPVHGEVLALVSLPTYDNNIFTSENDQIAEVLSNEQGLLLNRVVSGVYTPGSTVKMAIAAQALQEGEITAETKISGMPQVIRVGDWEFPDWTHSWGRAPHGEMDVTDAIAVSSDIFFYKIGGGFPPQCHETVEECQVAGLGVEGVVSALKLFGFGRTTGVDLPGEAAGLVPDPNWKLVERNEPWYLGNTYHLSIGQGDLLATPIQVINQVNIIAVDGQTPVPHLISNPEEVNDDRLLQLTDKPVYLDHLRQIRLGMVQAVEEGIIFPLRGALVRVAAKTGTAEFGTLNAKGEYQTHAWVTGYAPVENPALSFVFMLESGGKSSNAAELAREFIDWYFGEYVNE